MVKVAYIKWLDASGSSETFEIKDTDRIKPTINESAGIVVFENEERVTIGQDIWDNMIGQKRTRELETIPRAHIISLRTWEISDKHATRNKKGM